MNRNLPLWACPESLSVVTQSIVIEYVSKLVCKLILGKQQFRASAQEYACPHSYSADDHNFRNLSGGSQRLSMQPWSINVIR